MLTRPAAAHPGAASPDSGAAANVIRLKWGTRYGAHYVNRLYRGVSRNLRKPFRFFCCTDDLSGLDGAIETILFPTNPGFSAAGRACW